MNRDDIERMARAAHGHAYTNRYTPGETAFAFSIDRLEHFVAMAIAAERERNAQIADAHASIEGIAQAIATEIRGQQSCPHGVDDGNCKECYEHDTIRHNERQFIINFLESMHERCLGTHNYYLHAANCIRNLPPTEST